MSPFLINTEPDGFYSLENYCALLFKLFLFWLIVYSQRILNSNGGQLCVSLFASALCPYGSSCSLHAAVSPPVNSQAVSITESADAGAVKGKQAIAIRSVSCQSACSLAVVLLHSQLTLCRLERRRATYQQKPNHNNKLKHTPNSKHRRRSKHSYLFLPTRLPCSRWTL